MDIEGAGSRALVGGKELIKRYRPVFFIEVNLTWLLRDEKTPEGIHHFLETKGYVLQEIAGKSGNLKAFLAYPKEKCLLASLEI